MPMSLPGSFPFNLAASFLFRIFFRPGGGN
jgi:hypothetical protein